MNTFSILFDEYKKHKKLILAYITICIAAAFLCGPFIGRLTGERIFAATGTEPIGQTLELLTAGFLGNSITNLAGGYSNIVGVSCEPFTALAFIGLVENVNRLCGYPLPISSTPAGEPVVFLVISIFFVISKVMNSFEGSKILGLCTLGQLEKYLGLLFMMVLGILQVAGISNAVSNNVVQAATGESTSSAAGSAVQWTVGILASLLSILIAAISLVVYYIIKTVIMGLDVLQVGVGSFIPGFTAFYELMKTGFTISIILINLLLPPLGICLNLLIFFICCLLFCKCYRACTYLKKIYIKPFFRRIRGYDEKIPLVSPKFLKKFRKVNTFSCEGVDIAIPCFVLSTILPKTGLKKYQCVWFVHTPSGTSLIRKKGRKHIELPFPVNAQNPLYLRRGFRFFEAFSYVNTPSNLAKLYPAKSCYVVFSKEYFYRFEEICSLTGCVNYNELKQERKEQAKMDKAERKRIRKEERARMKEERRASRG